MNVVLCKIKHPMKKILVLLVIIAFVSCKSEPKKIAVTDEKETSLMAGSDTLIYPEEKYFKAIRQITFGGTADRAVTRPGRRTRRPG